MPSWPRPTRSRRLAYAPRRRACKPDRPGFATLHAGEPELLFGARFELPVATIHSTRGALYHWLGVRLAWLRPRAVPSVVALIALVGLLAVADHLTNLAQNGDPVATAPVIVLAP